MKTSQLRTAFLDYFAAREHLIVPPAPLVPMDDPTLLFVNAGMVPFKRNFTGTDSPPAPRCTSVQPCMRAGGKHNDLENVGFTKRHQTLFEMLGNFSFGDYFKEQAIVYAWEFVTKELGLPKERLKVTIHRDDKDSAALWQKVASIPDSDIIRLGDTDNLWVMGDVGPHGHCSEIFYDKGDSFGNGLPGTQAGDERWLEIWNLVFMQWNRAADGEVTELRTPCVDTGMGLERVASVLQGVDSNYETDAFKSLIESVAEHLKSRVSAADGYSMAPDGAPLRIVADHIRAVTFLIAQGVWPGNEGRSYVLRRVLRRAYRYAAKVSGLPQESLLLAPLVAEVAAEMAVAYPEIATKCDTITEAVADEEKGFSQTLSRGLAVFEKERERLTGDGISAELAFILYDTYGFPLDMTADIAKENDLKLDEAGFQVILAQQKSRSRAARTTSIGESYESSESIGEESGAQNSAVSSSPVSLESLESIAPTDFNGYNADEVGTTIVKVWKGGEECKVLLPNETGLIATETTPFYAEGGGQIADTGLIENGSTAENSSAQPQVIAKVLDCQKLNDRFLHQVEVIAGQIGVGERVMLRIDSARRKAIKRAHSATHLLHAALRNKFGEGVFQRGSWVGEDSLRFDFSHRQKLSAEELEDIESEVNALILKNESVEVKLMNRTDAMNSGAVALFGENYGEEVRVLSMANAYSVELCGGTHVNRLGDIGLVRLTSESSVAGGVRRIEALTGKAALAHSQEERHILQSLQAALRVNPDGLLGKVEGLFNDIKEAQERQIQLEKRLVQGGQKNAQTKSVSLTDGTMRVAQIDGLQGKGIRSALGEMERKLGQESDNWAAALLSQTEGDVVCMIAVSKALESTVEASHLLRAVTIVGDGKGGGSAGFARGGGLQAEISFSALADVLLGTFCAALNETNQAKELFSAAQGELKNEAAERAKSWFQSLIQDQPA